MSVLHDDQIPNAWMLLQVPDRERSHGGNSGYEDIYGAQYQYDSFVPNSNRLAKHDFVILRNKEHALGYGYIKEISSAPSMKLHRRCPECRSTKIRERVSILPKFACHKCKAEFDIPVFTESPCMKFIAFIEQSSYKSLTSKISTERLRNAAIRLNKQNAIQALNYLKISKILLFH